MRRRPSKKPRSTKTRVEFLVEFDAAPGWALFDQKAIAAVRGCSEALLERDRWAGTGIPFLRDGRSIRYRKVDVLAFLNKRSWPARSTAQADAADWMGGQ